MRRAAGAYKHSTGRGPFLNQNRILQDFTTAPESWPHYIFVCVCACVCVCVRAHASACVCVCACMHVCVLFVRAFVLFDFKLLH